MATKKAIQFLNDQQIFCVLSSSHIKPNLSWKNKDQLYDLECKLCMAVYSNTIITNYFAGSKKGTLAEYSFLLCKNCGASQETSDSPVKIKRTYMEYNVGPVQFPRKHFEIVDRYKGASVMVDPLIKTLHCYKELQIDDSLEPERCDCGYEKCDNCNPSLGPIFLNVTDALIASGLNPYEHSKRRHLVEFYSSRRHVTQHDYISFNKKYNADKKRKEREVLSSVDMSTLIKTIAEKSQFGNNRDEYALEPIVNTLDALGMEILDNGTYIKTIDERTGNSVTISIEDDEITMVRSDGCIKTGIITKDDIEDIIPEKIDPTEKMDEDEKKIFDNYVNTRTGCCSEINIHEYLKELFPRYEHGTIPVNGFIDGIYYNGLIDGIIRAEYGKTSSGGIIKPIVNGKRPEVIFEIKKRMKKIFSMEELIDLKYDLCQIVLYKILTQQEGTEQENPIKLVIIQSFDQDIDILRVPFDVQKMIYAKFREGIAQFKEDIKKLKKF